MIALALMLFAVSGILVIFAFTQEDTAGFFSIFIFILMFVAVLIIADNEQIQMRKEVIERGYAAYVVNPTNGNVSFEWTDKNKK